MDLSIESHETYLAAPRVRAIRKTLLITTKVTVVITVTTGITVITAITGTPERLSLARLEA